MYTPSHCIKVEGPGPGRWYLELDWIEFLNYERIIINKPAT